MKSENNLNKAYNNNQFIDPSMNQNLNQSNFRLKVEKKMSNIGSQKSGS